MSSDIIESKLVVINWCVCNNGVLNQNLTVPINNLTFQPDMYRIEEICCSNSNVNDNLFVITSNLSDYQPLISYSGRTTFPVNMSQSAVMSQPLLQLTFQLNLLGPDPNNPGSVVYSPYIQGINNFYPYPGPPVVPTTAYVSISINFFKLKSGKRNIFTI